MTRSSLKEACSRILASPLGFFLYKRTDPLWCDRLFVHQEMLSSGAKAYGHKNQERVILVPDKATMQDGNTSPR